MFLTGASGRIQKVLGSELVTVDVLLITQFKEGSSMRRFSWLRFLVVLFCSVLLVFGTACRGQQQEPQQPEYTPTATIKDLMLSIIDPSADVVWNSVATVVTLNGTEERVEEIFPRTDEEWTNVRHGVITLVEAANLLVMPGRRVARPGEKSEFPGIELEPEEMEVLINEGREVWNRRATALRDASLAALQAIDAQDADTLLEVGAEIEVACESCHLQYWYPNEVLPPRY